jgi:hypothetical protein
MMGALVRKLQANFALEGSAEQRRCSVPSSLRSSAPPLSAGVRLRDPVFKHLLRLLGWVPSEERKGAEIDFSNAWAFDVHDKGTFLKWGRCPVAC